jgi:hypothetical protein
MSSTASVTFYFAHLTNCTVQSVHWKTINTLLLFLFTARREATNLTCIRERSAFLRSYDKRIRRHHHPFRCQTSRPTSDSYSDFAPLLNFIVFIKVIVSPSNFYHAL